MKRASLAAVVVVAVSVGSLIGASLLDLRVPAAHREQIEADLAWTAGIPGLGLAIPGALLLRRMPRHPVAWLLSLAGVHWCLDATAGSWLGYATWFDLPGASAAFYVYQRLGAALMIWVPLLLLIYPSGRLPDGRWRIFAYASLALTGLMPVVHLFVPAASAQERAGTPLPEPFAGLNLDPTSIALPDGWWVAIMQLSFLALPLGMLAPVAVVVHRYRSVVGEDRLRMRWLLWAAIVNLLVVAGVLALPELSAIALGPTVGFTGAVVAVAIVRPTLLDIDRLLGGTVLYAAMAVTVLIVDACVLGVTGLLLGQSLPERDAAVVALLLVTAGYGPLRHRLWLLVRRLVLGRRDDPYRVVAGLAEQLERSTSPEDELLAVARAVAEAFRSPYVSVEVDQPGGAKVIATLGTLTGAATTLPISYRGETVGRVVLPADGPRVALSKRDERLLGDVVRQAAIAARSAHLVRELQRSRELIVAAREEERRRLRRDLHDGLGPTLGGVALRIDTARNLAAKNPQEADRLLKQAREDAGAAVADVRRLVHDLRPPALDDVGLLGAIRQQAARLRAPGLTVTVDGEGLDQLPAAVEVAAYRIASEALTNVVRHASATSCRIRLDVTDGELIVEITDDGVGIPSGTPTGVGLVSLRERAAELGGECRIECPGDRGTTVRARLPMGVLK
ncbi:sensor histidine kinase [Actinoplanes aureus]|uniref:GAF domain-containing sensor histidine kinase n=1 Tax=Actinoplanes aureus TaxID=2792083 RepID=A0A931C0P7_9ACTN|nr:GAF domain-containing sensor histidine kinase [Actinoplanes aureus]MBG0560149.1 GAF domain-containing sensor histidine kinase [Actinoplanes aureus]